MNYDEALAKVQNYLGDDCVVTRVLTRPYGWVFSYTARRYIETGNSRYGLIGNSPFFVSKTGEIARLSTAYPSTNLFLKNWELAHPDYEFPKPENDLLLSDFDGETVLTTEDEDQITAIANSILAYAIQLKAEETRFEVDAAKCCFRPLYKVGEDLQKFGQGEFYSLVAQRFKQMADIASCETGSNGTQSGTIRITRKEEKYDVVVTATKTENGEHLNLRIEAA